MVVPENVNLKGEVGEVQDGELTNNTRNVPTVEGHDSPE